MSLQVLASDTIIRINNFSLLGMVQSDDFTADEQLQDIYEFGRTTKVDASMELETSGTLEMISIGNTASLLARMVPLRDSSDVFLGYVYSGISNKNNYCFSEGDITEAQFDMVVYEQPDQAHFTRSFWFPRCFVTRITGRADANGNATETYQWAGQDLVTFESPFHDIIASPATVTDSTHLAVTDTVVAAATYTLVYVYVDQQRFRNGASGDATTFALSGAAGSAVLTLTTSEGFTIPANAICRAVFYKTSSPSTTFPVLASNLRDTSAFYVRGYQVNLFLAPANIASPQASEKWLCAQSVDYDINLRSEQLRELNLNVQMGTSIYARVPTLPFEVRVTCTVYEHDLNQWQAMLTKTFTGGNVYDNTLDFAPINLKQTIPVVMQYYTKAGVLLQTTTFSDLQLEQPGLRKRVQGRGEWTYQLRGTAVKWCGANA